ncbi:hypothetical protein LTR53_018067, partial [Teratosphaeriaceae sp. CCFEE 6253]
IASAALMTSVGIWACRWRELQPMAFGGKSSKGKQRAEGDMQGADGHLMGGSADGGEEDYAMGAGRGRGRDGAGSYEMVGMAPREPA